uniref:Uncharacterized protein n=1 Tax=Zooxanthella nutricula TaxID=1333877 RepID=A0A7S2HIV8_9DINO
MEEERAAEEAKVEEGMQGKLALAAACQPEVARYSSTSASSMFVQFVGVFMLNFLFESQAWNPFWWEAWFIYRDYGTAALIAYLPIAVVMDMLTNVLVAAALKWMILGKSTPGKHPLWGAYYWRWWFCNQLFKHVSTNVLPLIAETPLAGAFLRLFGAEVGRNVRVSVCKISDPDLVVLEDNATVGKQVRLATSAVMHGHLHLGPVRLGPDAAAGPGAVLSQQTEVPQGHAVMPLSTMPGWHGAVGAVAYQQAAQAEDASFRRRQGLLRACVGLPVVLLSHAAMYVPVIFVLQWFWSVCAACFGDSAFVAFSVLLAWVYVHPLWMSFVALVVAQKVLVVGPFRPSAGGRAAWSHWAELRKWLHARAVESHDFEEACEMWVNTEVLSSIYRLLGARVGRRVQIDHFRAVEHDCISIGDYAVFGSEVLFSCDARAPWIPEARRGNAAGYEPVTLGKGSNVLDHCVMMPGTTVGEKAVLGTCTLAAHRSFFRPLSISTGSQGGRALHLRDHVATEAAKALEDKAMCDVDNPWIWWRFNAVVALITMVFKPVPEALWVVTYFGVTAVWDPETGTLLELLLVTPLVYNIVCLAELLFVIVSKWLIIGRYKEGGFPFFGAYHMRWVAMTIVMGGAGALAEALDGTVFKAWVYRANGAKVGRNCYLSGLVVEYDLLSIGDDVAIGDGCDTTGHTVENMVIKLAATNIGNGAALCPTAFASPGTVLEDGAVLLENTQVLKGETVPAGEVWAGMPAARCEPRPPTAA